MNIRGLVVVGICGIMCQTAAQTSAWTLRIGGGLGVASASMPALADYANTVGRPSTTDRAQDFEIVASLLGSGDVRVTSDWVIGVRYERLTKTISSTPTVPGAGWEFEASLSMPAITVKRVLLDDGASIEAGGGVGLYSGTLRQRYVPASAEESFSGKGVGLLGEVTARTPLDDNLAAGIAVMLHWTMVDSLTNGSGKSPTYSGQSADLSFFMLGVQFVLSYQF